MNMRRRKHGYCYSNIDAVYAKCLCSQSHKLSRRVPERQPYCEMDTVRKRILSSIKHCDRTKVKTITVKNFKNSKKLSENFKLKATTFTQRHFQVKMNKKKLFEYKYTRNKSLEGKIFSCTFIFKYPFLIHFDLRMTLSKRGNVVAF